MKAAILGVTGFTGAGLLRLLGNHPNIDSVIPCSSSKPGEDLLSIDNGLGKCYPKANITNGKLVSPAEALELKPDVVFAALPHLKSAEIAAPFLNDSVVIDLSADFRIKDPELFFKAYGQQPPRVDLLQMAVYGLTDIYKEEVKKAQLIANPGCYPTCSLLPLIPIIKKYTLDSTIVVNALSGVSGAGRKADLNLIYCRRSENMNAYLPGKSHRHVTEIEKELHAFNANADLLFTPHLVPVRVGMIATTALKLKEKISAAAISDALEAQYSNSHFVKLIGENLPESANVLGTNRCDIGFRVVDDHQLMLFSTIDNLIKGASGQAIHNMNVRFSLDEAAGLTDMGAL